jgi:flagellar biosynthesis/type III secretory pathway M-ring protein FliF/YscJ
VTLVVVALVVILIAVVVALISAPLRRRDASQAASPSLRREELEAAREAKYRELRDLELDYRTGKLSDDDYRSIDRALRGEAVSILRELDELD